MKILVVCQYYKPEPFRISDICEELVKRGHEVMVVTGVPNYPEGIVYTGYEKKSRRDEVVNGVKIHRCFTIPRKKGVLYRFLNYYSYSISSSLFIKKLQKFDVVLVNQLSPVMMAEAAIVYKKKHKVPIVMYCLDLWPESLIAGGITRDSFIYKYFHRVSKKIYKQTDKILITSKLFSGYLQNEFQIKEEYIQYLPQYAESLFNPLSVKEDSSTYDFMFAGNIGTLQSVDTILKAAELLKKEREDLKWHIVGNGSELTVLKQMASDKKLDNVIFHGRKELEKMPEYYAKADAMLVTLRADEILSLTLPGKVQSYMAAGKPIIGAINGETATIIKEAKCGFCGPAEDVETLADNVRKYINCKEKEMLGQNARKFYEENFCRERFIDKMENHLK